MAKFYGVIGFKNINETAPGIYVETPSIERKYSGDYISIFRNIDQSDNINDNIKITDKISLVADSFALKNFHLMKYVVINEMKWKIKNIELRRPRLIITIGEIYYGN